MAEYGEILTDPYNPISIMNGRISFPPWLSEETFTIDDFPPRLNWTLEDYAINQHASFYDATIWYPWIKDFTH